MKKTIHLLLLLSILVTGCGSSGSSNQGSSASQTVDFSVKMDLFNALEKLTENLSKKKYIEGYDALKEITKLTNEAGISTEKSTVEGAEKYISTLETLSKTLDEKSKQQKKNEVYYDYSKQELTVLSSMISQGLTQSQTSGGGSGSSSGGSSGGSGGDSSGGGGSGGGGSGGGSSGSGSQDTSKGGTSGEEKQAPGANMIIPEQEFLKKYPEVVMTDEDKEIQNLGVDLMNYVTLINMDKAAENEAVVINREKYILYKINALSKLGDFAKTKDLIKELQGNWDILYLKVAEKSSQDIVAVNTNIKNIESALKTKNPVSIELQTKNAIQVFDELTNKLKKK